MNRVRHAAASGLLLTALALTGCGPGKDATQTAPSGQSKPGGNPADDVAAERAKLSPADRALVEAQEWCVVSSDERLGSMGPPLKLDIKGQPVFVCCKGCKRKAEADPDKTLAKVEELRAKKQKRLTTEGTENTETNKEKK